MTKITKARFAYSPVPSQRMAEIGQATIGSLFERWDRGMGSGDTPAPPLSSRYATRKVHAGGRPIRDLKHSGKLRRSIQVLSGGANVVEIGPVDGMHTRSLSFADVLRRNDARFPMFAASRSDLDKASRMVAESRPVREVEVK